MAVWSAGPDPAFPGRMRRNGFAVEEVARRHGDFALVGVVCGVGMGPGDAKGPAGFERAAQEAKAGCPVSKALTGVDITLDAALEG